MTNVDVKNVLDNIAIIAKTVVAFREALVKEGVPPAEVRDLTGAFQISLVSSVLTGQPPEAWEK